MALNLGANPLILILLSLCEVFFVIIPALISSRISKKPFLEEIKNMGFSNNFRDFKYLLTNILIGLLIGVSLFLISGFLMNFILNFLIIPIFGVEFLQEGLNNAISTQPYYPTVTEFTIIIIIQIIIIGPCEEAFFRGFLITKLSLKIKIVYSILLSSFFFALYHTPPFIVPITTIITFYFYYFIIGLVFAFTFIKFNRLLMPCFVAHSIFNILVLLI